jgi:hypothetical protein
MSRTIDEGLAIIFTMDIKNLVMRLVKIVS